MRLIDADALPKFIVFQPSDEVKDIINALTQTIAEAPTIDAEPRKAGYWLPYEFGDYHWHKCSVCGKADKYIETIRNYDLQSTRQFCPHCGARMHKEEL